MLCKRLLLPGVGGLPELVLDGNGLLLLQCLILLNHLRLLLLCGRLSLPGLFGCCSDRCLLLRCGLLFEPLRLPLQCCRLVLQRFRLLLDS